MEISLCSLHSAVGIVDLKNHQFISIVFIVFSAKQHGLLLKKLQIL